MEIKLNKNQTAFFEEAVKFFGGKSRSVKLAEMKKFAETCGLTVPTSVLKNYCQTDIRGHYDITKSGFDPAEPEEDGLFAVVDEEELYDVDIDIKHEDTIEEEQPLKESIIIETPVYANDPKPKKTRNKAYDDMFGLPDMSKKRWRNPIYTVQSMEGDLISVCDCPKKAYKKVNLVLHGGYTLTEKQALESLKKHAVVIIACTSATSLKAMITKTELNG